MSTSNRCILPELLDDLPSDDPRGRRARADLQRIHVAMRSISILRAAVGRLRLAAPPVRLLELGSGDGTLLLRFARAVRPAWRGVELTLLDRHQIVAPETLTAFSDLDWRVTLLRAEVSDWAAARQDAHYDLCFANLFLHHFDSPPLQQVLRAVAAASDSFVACEPRRSALARVGSRLLVFLGANSVTRGDAVKSVDAGFAGRELSALWDAEGGWCLDEYPGHPFSHCFIAVRKAAQSARVPA